MEQVIEIDDADSVNSGPDDMKIKFLRKIESTVDNVEESSESSAQSDDKDQLVV